MTHAGGDDANHNFGFARSVKVNLIHGDGTTCGVGFW
jgi:hypothetical protein